MIRRLWLVPAALAASFGMQGAALAGQSGQIVLERDTSGDDAYSEGSGGELRVRSFSGMQVAPVGNDVSLDGSPFSSFCLEFGENLVVGKTYDWCLNTEAERAGLLGLGTVTDPLDARTAYLYTQFWNGTLSNYVYDDLGDGPGERAESAGQLQQAIWYIEDEGASLSAGSQAAAWVQEAQDAIDDGDWTGLGNVRVLNLTYRNILGQTIKAQDQLVMVVPLPPAAMAGFVLLGGMGLVHRRRKKRLAAG